VTLALANFFGLLGGLLVLAYLANRFSRRTRICSGTSSCRCSASLGCGEGVSVTAQGYRAAVEPFTAVHLAVTLIGATVRHL